jgi:ubiquinone/menaquinone biosynthesis C-methylase UbiE
LANPLFSSSFSNIDAAANPTQFVDFMDDANAMEFFQAAKQRSYALMALQLGHHVLDVGCGTGDDVRAMAQLVGPTGHCVGVDSSTTMIEAARQRTRPDEPVEFLVGDAERLDLPDDSFDACRADRVLQHLSDPPRALLNMVRVLRPGGRLVVFEPDTGALLIDADPRDVTRKIINFRGDAVRSGWIGRQLPRLFKEIGLVGVDVAVMPSPRTDYAHTNSSLRLDYYAQRAVKAGVISAAEAEHWSASLAERAAAGTFFCLVTMFMVSGRKP